MTASLAGEEVIWHDVECASYVADLPLWLELARGADGAVLDIGCGTGRVALELARAGHRVSAIDSSAALVAALRGRARGHAVRATVADARSFELGRRFALAIAPMQVVQLLGGAAGRAAMLERARRHLRPRGILAVALADPFESVPPEQARPPLPDMREQDGWIYSSTPVAVYPDGDDATVIERVRQAVAPSGEMHESIAVVRVDRLEPDTLEREAAAQGFDIRPRRVVPATPDFVGSSVVVLEAP